MSMISSLIDELNKSADEWNVGNMFELARMCREAADTIWQLRDDLQRANAENAKLREQVADACMQLGGAWVRCTELRELVRISIDYCNSGTCDECPIQGEDGSCPYADMARELGVDV